jgi:hypothetical protein
MWIHALADNLRWYYAQVTNIVSLIKWGMPQILTFLQLENEEGRLDLPIMYVPESKAFYDLS